MSFKMISESIAFDSRLPTREGKYLALIKNINLEKEVHLLMFKDGDITYDDGSHFPTSLKIIGTASVEQLINSRKW